jgi:hypothetical protein
MGDDNLLLPGTRKIAHNCLSRGSRRLKSQIVQMHGHKSLKIATRRNEQQGRTFAPGIASQDGVDFLANRVTVVTVVYPHRLLPSDTNSSRNFSWI